MSCPVQPPSIPNDACGPGSGLTPLEPLPTPQFTRYQQPGVCPLPNGDPILDPDNLLLPLSSSWEQQTPWDAVRPVYVDSHPWTGGWSMLPSRGYGCNIGGYCPYACRAPYYETQWDNAWAGSAYWSLSTGDPIPSFMGFGRRCVWRVAAFLACHSTIFVLPLSPPPFKPSKSPYPSNALPSGTFSRTDHAWAGSRAFTVSRRGSWRSRRPPPKRHRTSARCVSGALMWSLSKTAHLGTSAHAVR